MSSRLKKLKNYELNIDRLNRDLQDEIAQERKRELQNEAKFQAINQGTASYEEFRQIVLAADLKPLRAEEITTMSAKKTPPWDMIGNREVFESLQSLVEAFGEGYDCQPDDSDVLKEFIAEWSQLTNYEDKLEMIFKYNRRPDFFGGKIPLRLYKEILCVMKWQAERVLSFQPHECQPHVETLYEMCTDNRLYPLMKTMKVGLLWIIWGLVYALQQCSNMESVRCKLRVVTDIVKAYPDDGVKSTIRFEPREKVKENVVSCTTSQDSNFSPGTGSPHSNKENASVSDVCSCSGSCSSSCCSTCSQISVDEPMTSTSGSDSGNVDSPYSPDSPDSCESCFGSDHLGSISDRSDGYASLDLSDIERGDYSCSPLYDVEEEHIDVENTDSNSSLEAFDGE